MISASEAAHLAVSRTGANLCTAYRNGASVGTSAAASTAHEDATLKYGLAGGAASTCIFATGFAAAGLTADMMAAMRAAELAYLTAVVALAP
jgi:hypothetical protein